MSRWPRYSHQTAAYVTSAGADWLASASPFPRSVQALWAHSPAAPVVLPCGTSFDVISMPPVFGRLAVTRLWCDGPGSGPVAAQRGRILVFASPGTAQRLPALLDWEEWGAAAPPLMCLGTGDAVTVPPLYPSDPDPDPDADPEAEPGTGPLPQATPGRPRHHGVASSRWLVAPDVRKPWLPGPEALLWACVRTARATSPGAVVTSLTSTPVGSPG